MAFASQSLNKSRLSSVLVTGGSGLLGGKLAELLRGASEVFATYHSHPFSLSGVTALPLEITSEEQVRSLMRQLRPQVVFHTAAWVDADGCERDKAGAFQVNVEGTRNVAEAARRVDARMAFVSSDYVFDGRRGNYTEEDQPRPISYYGWTKLEGERIVRELCPDAIIGRITVLYGWHPVRLNFVTWVIESLSRGQPIRVVTDQFGNPTLADAAAEALVALVRGGATGIFHITGRECLNRFQFAHRIARVFSLDGRLIEPITSQELGQFAPRPRFNCVDTSKAARFGLKLPTVLEGLHWLKAQREAEYGEESTQVPSLKAENLR